MSLIAYFIEPLNYADKFLVSLGTLDPGVAAAVIAKLCRAISRLIFCIINDNLLVSRGRPNRPGGLLSFHDAEMLNREKRFAVLHYEIVNRFWGHFCAEHVCDDHCFWPHSTFYFVATVRHACFLRGEIILQAYTSALFLS